MPTTTGSAIAETREMKVAELIANTRSLLDSTPLDRALLDEIRGNLQALAEHKDLWSEAEYAAPEGDENHARYLIGSEGNQGITLYLNVMRPGKKTPPHDHTVWACVAAVEGIEHNTLYTRSDDGTVDGRARIATREVIEVGPGKSLALMPDDIHSVEIRGPQTIWHLHFYGKPLETLNERKAFNIEAGTYKVMSIGVKTKK